MLGVPWGKSTHFRQGQATEHNSEGEKRAGCAGESVDPVYGEQTGKRE